METLPTIRCSFIVHEITRLQGDGAAEGEQLLCRVTTDTEGAYKQYFLWTPGGELRLSVLRKTGFNPGDRLQVDISRVA